MTELKPCPFCGGQVTIADYGDYLSIIAKGTDPKVSCRCRLFMESDQFSEDDAEARQRAKERLVEKWNRRFDGWHTGTPTEEGWYVVAYKKRDCDGSYYWDYGARLWIEIIEGEGHWNGCEEEHPVIAWQRIEPFKEESNG